MPIFSNFSSSICEAMSTLGTILYSSKYVKNMIAKDSLMLRRYILENEPGVNFEIEVQRPEILGGGSFKTFLEWDDNVFLNIT